MAVETRAGNSMNGSRALAASGRRHGLVSFILAVALLGCNFSALQGVVSRVTSSTFVGTPLPQRRASLQHGLRAGEPGASQHETPLPRPELPNSTEAMCRQAADAVMRAYRDGYTRQAVRMRLDAAYAGQEDLRALLKASLPLAKSFAAGICIDFMFRGILLDVF